MTPLKNDEIALLQSVLEKRAPALLAILLPKAKANAFNRDERRQLCELLGSEFAEIGIDEDEEPLPHGLRLEALIDVINRPNIENA